MLSTVRSAFSHKSLGGILRPDFLLLPVVETHRISEAKKNRQWFRNRNRNGQQAEIAAARRIYQEYVSLGAVYTYCLPSNDSARVLSYQ
jgi:hypothetical protein